MPQAAANPAIQQQIKAISSTIESRKAKLIAEMTNDYVKEENEITSQFDGDPLLKLKAREVDLRAMENERKQKEDDNRLALDKAKAMMSQGIAEEKLEQNEELAKLRAGVSLAKTGVQQAKVDFGNN